MTTPPPPTTSASQQALLNAAATSVAAATTSIQAALAGAVPAAPPTSEVKRLAKYFQAKAIEGSGIGFVFLLACFLDKSGEFIKFIHENFTQMPPIAVLIGILGGYIYALHPTKVGFVAAASRTWLDFVQQFFAIGTAAFWFIKLGLCLRDNFYPEAIKITWKWGGTNFIAMLIGALLIGSFWELKDTAVSKYMKYVAFITAACGLVFLLILMHSNDGGSQAISEIVKPAASSVGLIPSESAPPGGRASARH